MIDFNKNAWFSGSVTQADRDKAQEFEVKILDDLKSDKTRRFQLGVHLIELNIRFEALQRVLVDLSAAVNKLEGDEKDKFSALIINSVSDQLKRSFGGN